MNNGYQPKDNNIGKPPKSGSGVPPIKELIIVIKKAKKLLGIDPCIENPNYEIAKAICNAGYKKQGICKYWWGALGTWKTDCGNYIYPRNDDFKYCPYCGKYIKIVEYKKEGE